MTSKIMTKFLKLWHVMTLKNVHQINITLITRQVNQAQIKERSIINLGSYLIISFL